MLKLTAKQVYEKLLDYGMFPEKITSIYSSEKFGVWARKKGISLYTRKSFSNVTFHLTRNNNAPRILNIPHPIPYFFLCKEIKTNWTKISASIGEVDDYTNRSMVIPKPNNLSKRLVSMLSYDRNKDEKFLVLEKSFKAKYYVHADIANCYPSIYSHSIPWALVGKQEAKDNMRDNNRWYNKLDVKIRALQRNETVGIPIGPDSSSIISEIILSKIDKALSKYNYFRFIDDFKCYCNSKEESDNFIKSLSKELEKYHLRLNQKKTEIIELPKTIEEDWVRDLKAYANKFLTESELSKSDINYVSEFIDLSIKLTKKNPNDSALRYAVKVISDKRFADNDVYVFTIMYLSRICFIYPYFIDVFYEILNNNPPNAKMIALFSKEINSILKEHLEYSRSDVALWGLFLAMKFNFKIESFNSYSDYLINDRDCLPSLLCYYYAAKNGLNTDKYFDLIDDLIKEKQEEEWWIYIYTLFYENGRKHIFRRIECKDFYSELKKGKVEFYNK